MARIQGTTTSSKPVDAPEPPSDQPTFRAPGGKRLAFMPGQYFIRVQPEALRPHTQARRTARSSARRIPFTASTADAVPEAVVEPLDFLRDNAGLKSIRPLFADAVRRRVASANVSGRRRDRLAVAAAVLTERDDELAGLAIAEMDPKAKLATIRRAEAARAIDYIEPIPTRWLSGTPVADPTENLQWGLRAIRWFRAARPDASTLSVGILDTGIDVGHPDLVGVDIKYHHPGVLAEDILGHGTHVAGIIAAETNNDVGIAGVASCAIRMWKVFPDKPLGGEYYVDPSLFADALRSAASSGVSSVNLSLGGTASSRTEQILIRRLIDSGVLVVAAMGNEYHDGNPVEYPAGYADVLAVGAIAENRQRSSFSNTGEHIGVCAPGSNILSTLPRRRSAERSETQYASWSGTSMATPHVAAAAVLVSAKQPDMAGPEVAERLRASAFRLSGMKGAAWTDEYGNGLLDLWSALS